MDVLVLVETWHGLAGDVAVGLAKPPGFSFVDFVRPHDPAHGGLVIYFRSTFGCNKITLPVFTTFEAIAIKLKIERYNFILLSIYRPGSAQIFTSFFNELISVLEHITMMNIILMGDFNVHVERMDDPHTIRLLEIFDMFDLVNHVKGKTHSHGGTLDLIVSSRSFPVAEISIHPSEVYSDHGCIVAKITIPRSCGNFVKKLARSWKDLDEDQFKESILKSAIAAKHINTFSFNNTASTCNTAQAINATSTKHTFIRILQIEEY
ncbi:hypothetical protein HELRODRAFT_158761 [Helobdella robusta]|uniref:Endonuclease/exonuclease/phosphatase domain-containing protein n=1 Tax=Helobdella robusta TaxID=6412 RepID=T1EN82_HELRO|nr:hypothetical protein HELRODRAFT_158761 [Helobdella robusta]ESO12279.1 hypothetical protein HELRODRAFT_158761 [Helobdella robusta]